MMKPRLSKASKKLITGKSTAKEGHKLSTVPIQPGKLGHEDLHARTMAYCTFAI
jgi:hypothetical protein